MWSLVVDIYVYVFIIVVSFKSEKRALVFITPFLTALRQVLPFILCILRVYISVFNRGVLWPAGMIQIVVL